MSERVRFDNVCYVIDGRKQSGSDLELSADKASVGSCRSFRSSDRSFRDDVGDSASLSSLHKRIMSVQQRLAKTQQHLLLNAQRTSSGAGPAAGGNPAATSTTVAAAQTPTDTVTTPTAEAPVAAPESASQTRCNSSDHLSPVGSPSLPSSAHGSPTSQTSFVCSRAAAENATATATSGAETSSATPTAKTLNTKNMSKVAILRNLFFSQHPHGDGDAGEGSSGNNNGSGTKAAQD